MEQFKGLARKIEWVDSETDSEKERKAKKIFLLLTVAVSVCSKNAAMM